MNRPFSLLIKPASSDCNLRCDYCFYSCRADLYPETAAHRMEDEVLSRLIASYLATEQPQYVFCWQGGEPIMMGIDFYRRVTDLQSRYGHRGAVVANGLQTNAVLITDALASHFAAYRFLVGVSLDGPESVHNVYRRYGNGSGSYAEVLRGIDCLKRQGVEFNILTLITQANVHRPCDIYHFLCAQGIFYHQYIPCVEFDQAGRLQPYSISAKEWGKFLADIFDEWFRHDTRKVSVRLFDSILVKLVEGRSTICHMEPDCCQYFVVEYNGDVYPCDFFVDKKWKLGNIMERSWEKIQALALYRQFGRQKSDRAAACRNCQWLALCAGDCLKHRKYNGQSAKNISWLCEGWQHFFSHSMSGFQQLAELIRSERQSSG